MAAVEPAATDVTPAAPRSKGYLLLSAANLAFRGLTMLSKFALIVVLADYIGATANGYYRTVLMTVTTVTTLLSLRFDLFTTRELCSQPKERHLTLIRDQFLFHGSMYLVFGPFTLLLFVGGLLPWSLALPFYLILVSEHVSNELSRLLIPLSKPVHSNFIMFLRNGLWVYVLIAWFMLDRSSRTLENVWVAWIAGAGVSILLGAWWLYRTAKTEEGFYRVDWSWIKRGVKTSVVFSIGIAFLTSIFTIDNYVLKHYAGEQVLGAYAVYNQISNLIQTIGETGVMLILLPAVLGAFARRDRGEFVHQLGRLRRDIWIAVAVAVPVAVAGTWAMLWHFQTRDPVYGQHLTSLVLLLLMGVVNTIILVPHYALYAMNREREIAICNGIALVAAVVLYFTLTPTLGILGTSIAALSSMGVLYVLKEVFMRRHLAEWKDQARD